MSAATTADDLAKQRHDMPQVSIYKIVAHADGTFTLNQESNGYWWYHDTKYPTEAAAREAVAQRSTEMFPTRIDQDFVPVNMRPRK